MKAIINPLWNTGRKMISFDTDELHFPSKISELKQCENVIICEKTKANNCRNIRHIIIDDKKLQVSSVRLNHPTNNIIFQILEIN